jgi:Mycoplasma protein of unknown function, DUF285
MSWMFAYTKSFNGDLSQWNISSVTRTYGMFDGATAFAGNLANWDMTSVTDMAYMFSGATSFTVTGLSNWRVTNVKYMSGAFQWASSFQENLCSWGADMMGTVVAVDAMFDYTPCPNLTAPILNIDPISPLCFTCEG